MRRGWLFVLLCVVSTLIGCGDEKRDVAADADAWCDLPITFAAAAGDASAIGDLADELEAVAPAAMAGPTEAIVAHWRSMADGGAEAAPADLEAAYADLSSFCDEEGHYDAQPVSRSATDDCVMDVDVDGCGVWVITWPRDAGKCVQWADNPYKPGERYCAIGMCQPHDGMVSQRQPILRECHAFPLPMP